MSVFCAVECVVVLGCLRWGWRRCTYIVSDDSSTWSIATFNEFSPVPRASQAILANYESNLLHPKFPPGPNGYCLDLDCFVKRVTYAQTLGHAPPYLNHEHREIIVAI